MIARLGSRPTEKVAPMASRLMPSSKASGSPTTMVPTKWPSSWKASAQPAAASLGSELPTIRPSLAMNSSNAGCRIAAALNCKLRSSAMAGGQRSRVAPKAAPSNSAQTIGSSTTLAKPRFRLAEPISSETTRMMAAKTYNFSVPAVPCECCRDVVPVIELMLVSSD